MTNSEFDKKMIFLKNNWNFSVKKEFFVQVKIKGTLFSFNWNVKYNKKKEKKNVISLRCMPCIYFLIRQTKYK